MKKAICIILLIAFFTTLCGCSKNNTFFEMQPFSCKITLSDGKENTEVTFTYENDKSMYMDFSDVEHINGVRVHYCDGVYNLIFDGMSVELYDDFSNTPLYGVFEAVELIGEYQDEVNYDSEGVFSLSKDNREYIYTVDKDNGRILKIESDSAEIIFGH